jgi:hypothetical protein
MKGRLCFDGICISNVLSLLVKSRYLFCIVLEHLPILIPLNSIISLVDWQNLSQFLWRASLIGNIYYRVHVLAL